MPCIYNTQEMNLNNAEKRLKLLESMLCHAFTVAEKQILEAPLEVYIECGTRRADMQAWWDMHQLLDEQRRQKEAKEYADKFQAMPGGEKYVERNPYEARPISPAATEVAPAPEAPTEGSGWVAHTSEVCPVPGDTLVRVRFWSGAEYFGTASAFEWAASDDEGRIVEYRIVN